MRLLAGFGLFSWVSPPSQKIKTFGLCPKPRKDARALDPLFWLVFCFYFIVAYGDFFVKFIVDLFDFP